MIAAKEIVNEKEGRHIGSISIGDAMKANLQARTSELKDLNAMVSWNYYEDWRWQKPIP